MKALSVSANGKRALTWGADRGACWWDLEQGKKLESWGAADQAVMALALLPDGNKAIVSSRDGGMYLMDLAGGLSRVRDFKGHKATITSIDVSADGKRAVSGDDAKSIRLWNVETGEQLQEWTADAAIRSIRFAADGRSFLTLTADDKALVWEVGKEGAPVDVAGKSGTPVRCAALSADGKHVLYCWKVGSVVTWDRATRFYGDTRGTLTPPVHTVALSADGKLRAAAGAEAGADGKSVLRLWPGGMPEIGVSGKPVSPGCLAFTPDGRRLVLGGPDGALRVLEVPGAAEPVTSPEQYQFRELRRLKPPGNGDVPVAWSLAISRDGKRLVSGGDDRQVRVWDVENGTQLKFWSHASAVHTVGISPDGKFAVSGSRFAVLFETDKNSPPHEVKAGPEQVLRVAVSPGGKQLLLGYLSGHVVLWDLTTDKQLKEFKGHTPGKAIGGVAFCPDNEHVVTAGGDKTVRLWSVKSGEQVRLFEGHDAEINDLVVSPDGTQALSASFDRTVRLWDLKTGDALRVFRGHDGPVYSAAFLPDGRHFVSGSLDKTVRLWDLKTGKELARFEGHSGPVWKVVAADNRHIVSSGGDKTVRVLELVGGGPADVAKDPGSPDIKPAYDSIKGHGGAVRAVSVTADGKWAATVGADNLVCVWDVGNGTRRYSVKLAGAEARAVALLPDGRRALVAGKKREINLFDLSNAKMLARVSGHKESVNSLDLTPDGRWLISGGEDGAVRLTDVELLKPDAVVESRLMKEVLAGPVAQVRLDAAARTATSLQKDQQGLVWQIPDAPGGKDRDPARTVTALFTGEPKGIRAMTISRDGKAILLGIGDGGLKLDLPEAKRAFLLAKLPAAVTAVALSPGGKYLAGSDGKTLVIFDAVKIQAVKRVDVEFGVTALEFAGDTRLIVGGPQGHIHVWSLPGGRPSEVVQTPENQDGVRAIKAHPGAIRSLAVAAKAARAVTLGEDDVVRLWDLESGKLVKELPPFPRDGTRAVAILPDGRHGAVGAGKDVLLYDLETGTETGRVTGHEDTVLSLDVSADGKWLLSGAKDFCARIADATKPGKSRLLEKKMGSDILYVRASADAQRIVTRFPGQAVILWRVDREEPRRSGGMAFYFDLKAVGVAISPDGSSTLLGSENGSVILAHSAQREVLTTLKGSIRSVAIGPDGKHVAFAGDEEKVVVLWDLATKKEVKRITAPVVPDGLAFTGDGKRLVAAGPDGVLRVWSLPGGGPADVVKPPEEGQIRELPRIKAHTGPVLSIGVSADGGRLLTAGADKRLALWDLKTGGKVISAQVDDVTSAALLPDGKRVLYAVGRSISLWDTAKEGRSKFDGHTGLVLALAVSPDGKWAVSGGNDKDLRVWDLEKRVSTVADKAETAIGALHLSGDGKLLMVGLNNRTANLHAGPAKKIFAALRGPQEAGGITAGAVSADGKLVLTGLKDGTVQVNNVRDRLAQVGPNLTSLQDPVVALAISPDGHYYAFAAFGKDNRVLVLWDAKAGKELKRFKQSVAPNGLVFTPDGKRLLAACLDGNVRSWEIGGGSSPPDPRPDAKPVVAEVKVGSGPGVKSPIGRLDHLAVSADGRRALASNPSNVCTWSLEKEPKPLRAVKTSSGAIALALTPDGKLALTSHIDKSLQLLDVQSAKPKSVGETPTQVMHLSLSPKGDRAILSGSGNGQGWIWDVAKGERLHEIRDGGGTFVTAFLPDGKRALTATGRTLTFWDVSSGERGRVLTGKGKRIDALAVSADGKRAVTGGGNGEVWLWDLEGGKEPVPLEGIPAMDYLHVSVALSPDGRLVAGCAAEGGPGPGHLRFWDAASGKEVGKLDGPDHFLCDIAFVSNLRLVARGKQDTVETLLLRIRTATGEERVETPKPETTPETTPGDRKPRPSEELVKDSLGKLKKEFEKDYARLTTDKSMQALADALVQKAAQAKDDPATRFACLQEARDLAAKGRDPARSFKAVDELAREFDVDGLALKVEALKLVPAAANAVVARAVLEAVVALCDEAKAGDNYAAVVTLAGVARQAGAAAGNAALKKSAEERLALVTHLNEGYPAYKEAVRKLRDAPDDAEANKTAGAFLCFAKHDWDKGLPLLAKGSDAALAALAKKDLTDPTDAKEQEALGKGWDDQAAKVPEAVRGEVEKRAYHWYVRVPDPGAAAAKRLAQLARKYPDVQGPLDLLDTSKVRVTDGFVRLDAFGKSVRTRQSYSGPIEITLVARTAKNNIRIKAFAQGLVIFNWENKNDELRVHRPDTGFQQGVRTVPLTPNAWHTLRWRILDKGMEVYADDKLVFSEKASYDLSRAAPVEVPTWDSVVDVKSISVKSLGK